VTPEQEKQVRAEVELGRPLSASEGAMLVHEIDRLRVIEQAARSVAHGINGLLNVTDVPTWPRSTQGEGR
jgi:hypothetical protein